MCFSILYLLIGTILALCADSHFALGGLSLLLTVIIAIVSLLPALFWEVMSAILKYFALSSEEKSGQ